MTGPTQDAALEVSTADTAAALADDSATVIDVREPYEWEAGRMPGARHIELGLLTEQAPTIDRDRPVIFQCRSGVRSLMAAQAFQRAGFQASSMAGGLVAWAAEGRPLEPEDGSVADH